MKSKLMVVVFLASFIASALTGLALSSCVGDDCNCPEPPSRPAAQGPLSLQELESFDEQGEQAQLEVQPADGTLEVTQDEVIIVYTQDDVEHRVVYSITGPPGG